MLMNLINELEEKFPVDRWIIDSVHVWPLIRIHLYFSFFDSKFLKNKSVRAGTIMSPDVARIIFTILRSIWKFSCAYVMDFQKSSRADRQCDVLLLNYNTYMTLVNGSWYSRLCDPFVAHLSERDMSCLMLTAGYEYSIPRFTKSIFIQPYLTIHRLIGILSRNSKDERLEQLRQLENYVRQSGLFPASFRLIKPVRRHVKQIAAIERYFKRLLVKTKPRAVFVTSCYSTESMALILACHHMGIPSVDIQHGFQGDLHIAYGRWNRLPENGYELLPTTFWCWSDDDAATIKEWSKNVNVHQPIVGGNLFLQRWLDDGSDMVRSYDKTMNGLKGKHKDKIHILYSLNGETKNELQIMVDIIDGVNDSGLESCFWLRLHPVTIDRMPEVKKMLEENGIENFELDNATELPLYAILRHTDIHVTEASSVVIEAEAFSVPSVIFKLGVESFRNQISSGWSVPAYSISEVVSAIQLQLGRRPLLTANSRAGNVSGEKAFEYLFDLISQYAK